MAREEKSKYLLARKEAAKKEPQLASREKASGLLGISAQSLQNYETGKTPIPVDVVVKMASLYNAPYLRSHYCSTGCAIGEKDKVGVEEEHLELDRLTLRLLSTFKEVSSVKAKLIDIAADGVITPDEEPTLNEIIDTLDAISKNAEALKLWAERELSVKK